MKRSNRTITNHAMIGYLSQCEGLDIAALCAKIRRRVDAAEVLDGTRLIIEGIAFELRDGTVIDVVSEASAKTAPSLLLKPTT